MENYFDIKLAVTITSLYVLFRYIFKSSFSNFALFSYSFSADSYYGEEVPPAHVNWTRELVILNITIFRITKPKK